MESSRMSEREVSAPRNENKIVTQTQTHSESQCECETHEIQSQMYSTLRVGKKLPSLPGRGKTATAVHAQGRNRRWRRAGQKQLPPGTFTWPNNAMRWWRILQ